MPYEKTIKEDKKRLCDALILDLQEAARKRWEKEDADMKKRWNQ